jgi:hypothetical protein
MDRNEDRDGDRRRGTPVPRATKLAALEKSELPDYGHLRHIMTELTKFVFFRKVPSNLADGNNNNVAIRLYSKFRII